MKYLVFLTLFILVSCSKKDDGFGPSTGVAKGNRKFGMHVTYGGAESFNTAFNIVVNNRFDLVNLHQIWGDGGISGVTGSLTTNASGTAFDFTTIDIANSFYPSYNMGLSVTIGTIDTNNKFVPSSFNATAFDQVTIRNAFKSLLTNMLPRLSATRVLSLQLGNEVDIYLGSNAAAWAQYKTFFDDVSAHAKSINPSLKVGVTTTLYGTISSAQKAFIQNLNTNADFVSVTYYPMDANFTFKDPALIDAELSQLISLYPTKPIYLQEMGYGSGSSYIGSSPAQQAEAVKSFFVVWDKYPTQIPQVSWLNLTEWSQSAVDAYGTQYGMCPGSHCNAFKEYLKTLGLRDYTTGVAKPALTEIINQTNQRGW